MKRVLDVSLFFLSVLLCLSSVEAMELPGGPLPSFTYNGQAVNATSFTTNGESLTQKGYREQEQYYVSPDGKFQVKILSKSYTDFPAMEYSVELSNLSSTDSTELVDNFLSLDWELPLSFNSTNNSTDNSTNNKKDIRIDAITGSLCNPDDFTPVSFTLAPGEEHRFDEVTGRSSHSYLPFMELNLNEESGLLLAVGWTGCWAADFVHKGETALVRAGMERSHFKLLPGESVRQPSILLFQRDKMTRREFRTMMHRFMIDYKSPRDLNGNVIPPILPITAGGGNKTPQMMLDILQYSTDHKFPFDTFWVDAGWYGATHDADPNPNCGAEWGIYVGDWRFNTTTHPDGNLLRVTSAVHNANMKFLLWFEPERMEDGAPILKTHPEYRLNNLVDYGNPDALAWIQNEVYSIIDENKIDIYRQDFNMEPGPIWREHEEKDRIGMLEARHVTGLYKFLDDMRARFPGMLQENCASGGRRIDFEMVSRAHSYCRSDYYIGPKPDDTAFHMGQNNTLNTLAYLPFQGGETNCASVFDDYGIMSVVSSSSVFTPTDFDGAIIRRPFSEEETAWFKKIFGIADRVRPYYLGEFYPLTDDTTSGDTAWCGWQLDRPDLDSGFVIIFRRKGAPDATREFQPGAIDTKAEYELEFFDGTRKTVSGSELATWKVSLDPRSFQFFFYTKKQ